MATSTDLTTSFNNTPQAVDDYYTAAQTGLLEDSMQTIYLAVMANDLGGKAKTLYSLDDGIENEDSASSADLLVQDVVGVCNYSQYGATIAIRADGTVAYTMTEASRAHFNSLGAGEFGYDSFTYAIRLGNGTLSWATATVEIRGVNDAPVVTNAAAELAGSVQEDTTLAASGQLSASDVDNGSNLTWSVQGNVDGAYGSIEVDSDGQWTYTLANDSDAVQALAAGESHDETFIIRVADEHGAFVDQTITVTINGTNDAAIISGDSSGTVTEDDNPNTATGTLSASDVDNPDNLFQANSGNGASGYGSFAVDTAGNWTYTLNNGNPAVDALNVGDSLSDSFTVLSDDGTAQLVSVTITGTNDMPLISGVSTGSVQEDTNIVGGQLTTSGTLTISDADAGQSSFQAQPTVAGSYGSFTLAASGNWTYSVNNSLAAIQALQTGQLLTDSFTAVSLDGSASQLVEVSIHGLNDVTPLTGTTANNDMFSFSAAASGAFTITDPGGNGDTIQVTGNNATLTSLNFERVDNDLAITINDQQITVLNQYGASTNAIENISFASGQSFHGYALAGSYTLVTSQEPGSSNTNWVLAGSSAEDALQGGNNTNQRDLIFGNDSNDTLTGRQGNDLLVGGAGNDLLRGEAGLDTLLGGLGNDTLIGGTGADTFKFAETGALNLDSVLDYSFAEGDKLDLSALLDANFVSGSQVSDFVKLVQTGTDITVQVDVNGAAGGASFTDVAVLTNSGTSGSDLVRAWFGDVDHTLTV